MYSDILRSTGLFSRELTRNLHNKEAIKGVYSTSWTFAVQQRVKNLSKLQSFVQEKALVEIKIR